MYKFFGEPLKIIMSKTSNKPVFRFDTKGEFITDDKEIIKRALGYFDYIKMDATLVGEKVEKTVNEPKLTIKTKDKDINKLTYKEIQKLAKERGIKSFGVKQEDLVEQLKEV